MSEKKATRVGYGEALVELGAENEKIVVLDADLSCSTMTNGFAKAYPDRFFNAGIAEANMVTMAAGLSSMGYIPFCSTFAVFASRCYEQIRNGVCHPHLNVKFAFTHAGITVGEEDGVPMPSPEEARPKLWEMAAPTKKPMTVTAESVLPSPARISWRRGQPPSRTEPQPTMAMPSRFHRPSVWAMG